ncbi:hypothetical protein J1605_017924 [Eschrichtius robustus]|uniref:Secreted protein n=1 Tax=Eschrichtius robustus TaxID=9764 RepID=A0AB34HYN6_ESCRO|nr:hypothetical protein J1605_017924 [Eschrichtius robustus]
MGCSASIVLLQAFRSVVQRSCPHICRRRQEEPSHEILPLESDDEMSRPRTLIIMSTGSRRADSVVVAHGPSCSVTCGIFPDQGSNPCPLH